MSPLEKAKLEIAIDCARDIKSGNLENASCLMYAIEEIYCSRSLLIDAIDKELIWSIVDNLRRFGMTVPIPPRHPDREIWNILHKDDGCLEMSSWHVCETSHCHAGWLIHVSPGGYELESDIADVGYRYELMKSLLAGFIIWLISYGTEEVPCWDGCQDNDVVMERIRAHAERDYGNDDTAFEV